MNQNLRFYFLNIRKNKHFKNPFIIIKSNFFFFRIHLVFPARLHLDDVAYVKYVNVSNGVQ